MPTGIWKRTKKHLQQLKKQGFKKGHKVRSEHRFKKGHKSWSKGKKLPEFTGKNAHNWKGGISYLPYCEKFDGNLKERVRDFFGRCCYVCGKNEIDNGRKLDVHHVNYDKMVCCNDVKPLFVPLCHSCHEKTLKDREYWEEFFTVSLEYLTDGKCFLPKKVDSLLIEEKKNEKL